MGEDIFTAICGVLVINIHIIVYGAPRVPSCRVQSAPLSTAGVGGKGRAGSKPPAWTPGRRQGLLSGPAAGSFEGMVLPQWEGGGEKGRDIYGNSQEAKLRAVLLG